MGQIIVALELSCSGQAYIRPGRFPSTRDDGFEPRSVSQAWLANDPNDRSQLGQTPHTGKRLIGPGADQGQVTPVVELISTI